MSRGSEPVTLNESTTHAIAQLFRNKQYLPLHPFKILLQCLLRDEASEGLHLRRIDYMELPEERVKLVVKLVGYGSSGCAGSLHLAKLFNTKSLTQVKLVHDRLKEVLGSQPESFSTQSLSANFIEVLWASSCFNHLVSQTRHHRLDVTLEVIVKGFKFEECLNVFIRRVLEEATASFQSDRILTAHLFIVADNGTTQKINISKMKFNRARVLSLLRAAVVSDNDIYLDFYLQSESNMLAGLYLGDRGAHREPTHGFIHVRRHYHLSCVDKNNHVRCFSKVPIESLATGVFVSLKEADLYLDIYAAYISSLSKKAKARELAEADGSLAVDGSYDDSQVSPFNAIVLRLSKRVEASLANGDFVEAAEDMIVLISILLSENKQSTHCMSQIHLLMYGKLAQIKAVRDAVAVLRSSIRLLLKEIIAFSEIPQSSDIEDINHAEKLKNMFGFATSSIFQIRMLILELIRGTTYSEFLYVSEYLTVQMWALFDPLQRSIPLLAKVAHDAGIDITPPRPVTTQDAAGGGGGGNNKSGSASGEEVGDEILSGNNHSNNRDAAKMKQTKSASENISSDNSTATITATATSTAVLDKFFERDGRAQKQLQATADVLETIHSTLHMVELTVGMEIFVNILRQDEHSYQLHIKRSRNTRMRSNRSDQDGPRCMLDLIGFINARVKASIIAKRKAKEEGVRLGSLQLKKAVIAEFDWSPLRLSELLTYQLLPDDRPNRPQVDKDEIRDAFMHLEPPPAAAAGAGATSSRSGTSAAAAAYTGYSTKALTVTSSGAVVTLSSHREAWWDLYAHMGSYALHKLGAIDFPTAADDEWDRADVPLFMTREGAQVRYLAETHVLRALHEAFFLAALDPAVRPRLSSINQYLFKFPAFLQIWSEVTDADIEQYLFHTARTNAMHITGFTSRQRKNLLTMLHHDSLDLEGDDGAPKKDSDNNSNNSSSSRSVNKAINFAMRASVAEGPIRLIPTRYGFAEAVHSSSFSGNHTTNNDRNDNSNNNSNNSNNSAARAANTSSSSSYSPTGGGIKGGVFGPARVLTALGPDAVNLFGLAWTFPPLFGSAPNPMTATTTYGTATTATATTAGGGGGGWGAVPSKGCGAWKVKVCCGLAVGTAIELCTPTMWDLQYSRRCAVASEEALKNYLEQQFDHREVNVNSGKDLTAANASGRLNKKSLFGLKKNEETTNTFKNNAIIDKNSAHTGKDESYRQDKKKAIPDDSSSDSDDEDRENQKKEKESEVEEKSKQTKKDAEAKQLAGVTQGGEDDDEMLQLGEKFAADAAAAAVSSVSETVDDGRVARAAANNNKENNSHTTTAEESRQKKSLTSAEVAAAETAAAVEAAASVGKNINIADVEPPHVMGCDSHPDTGHARSPPVIELEVPFKVTTDSLLYSSFAGAAAAASSDSGTTAATTTTGRVVEAEAELERHVRAFFGATVSTCCRNMLLGHYGISEWFLSGIHTVAEEEQDEMLLQQQQQQQRSVSHHYTRAQLINSAETATATAGAENSSTGSSSNSLGSDTADDAWLSLRKSIAANGTATIEAGMLLRRPAYSPPVNNHCHRAHYGNHDGSGEDSSGGTFNTPASYMTSQILEALNIAMHHGTGLDAAAAMRRRRQQQQASVSRNNNSQHGIIDEKPYLGPLPELHDGSSVSMHEPGIIYNTEMAKENPLLQGTNISNANADGNGHNNEDYIGGYITDKEERGEEGVVDMHYKKDGGLSQRTSKMNEGDYNRASSDSKAVSSSGSTKFGTLKKLFSFKSRSSSSSNEASVVEGKPLGEPLPMGKDGTKGGTFKGQMQSSALGGVVDKVADATTAETAGSAVESTIEPALGVGRGGGSSNDDVNVNSPRKKERPSDRRRSSTSTSPSRSSRRRSSTRVTKSGKSNKDDSSSPSRGGEPRKQLSFSALKESNGIEDTAANNSDSDRGPDDFAFDDDNEEEEEGIDDETDAARTDPTFDDVGRLYANSDMASVLHRQRSRATAKTQRQEQQHAQRFERQSSVDTWPVYLVPCRIRFTLLVQVSRRATHMPLRSGPSTTDPTAPPFATTTTTTATTATPNDMNINENRVPRGPRYSPVVGFQANPLLVGSDAALARLVSSTLYFSPQATRSVWRLLHTPKHGGAHVDDDEDDDEDSADVRRHRNGGVTSTSGEEKDDDDEEKEYIAQERHRIRLHGRDLSGEGHCIQYEARKHWMRYAHDLKHGRMCNAYVSAAICAALTQQYQISVSVARALDATAFRLQRIQDCIALCAAALSPGAGALSESVSLALGLSISTHICLALRQIMSAAQMTHFRGGACYILKCVDQIEDALLIGSIPAQACTSAEGRLPTSLNAYPHPRTTLDDDYGDDGMLVNSTVQAVEVEGNNDDNVNTTTNANNKDTKASGGYVFTMPSGYKTELGDSLEEIARQTSTTSSSSSDPISFTASANSNSNSSSAVGTSAAANSGRGAAAFLLALSHPRAVNHAHELLLRLHGLLHPLVYVLCQDFHSNFKDVEAALSTMPPMCPAIDVMETVLGPTCPYEAVANYITRAGTIASRQLEEFHHLQYVYSPPPSMTAVPPNPLLADNDNSNKNNNNNSSLFPSDIDGSGGGGGSVVRLSGLRTKGDAAEAAEDVTNKKSRDMAPPLAQSTTTNNKFKFMKRSAVSSKLKQKRALKMAALAAVSIRALEHMHPDNAQKNVEKAAALKVAARETSNDDSKSSGGGDGANAHAVGSSNRNEDDTQSLASIAMKAFRSGRAGLAKHISTKDAVSKLRNALAVHEASSSSVAAAAAAVSSKLESIEEKGGSVGRGGEEEEEEKEKGSVKDNAKGKKKGEHGDEENKANKSGDDDDDDGEDADDGKDTFDSDSMESSSSSSSSRGSHSAGAKKPTKKIGGGGGRKNKKNHSLPAGQKVRSALRTGRRGTNLTGLLPAEGGMQLAAMKLMTAATTGATTTTTEANGNSGDFGTNNSSKDTNLSGGVRFAKKALLLPNFDADNYKPKIVLSRYHDELIAKEDNPQNDMALAIAISDAAIMGTGTRTDTGLGMTTVDTIASAGQSSDGAVLLDRQRRQQEQREHLEDHGRYSNDHSFSATGFRLAGESVQKAAAAENKSMLSLLRVYGGSDIDDESLRNASAAGSNYSGYTGDASRGASGGGWGRDNEEYESAHSRYTHGHHHQQAPPVVGSFAQSFGRNLAALRQSNEQQQQQQQQQQPVGGISVASAAGTASNPTLITNNGILPLAATRNTTNVINTSSNNSIDNAGGAFRRRHSGSQSDGLWGQDLPEREWLGLRAGIIQQQPPAPVITVTSGRVNDYDAHSFGLHPEDAIFIKSAAAASSSSSSFSQKGVASRGGTAAATADHRQLLQQQQADSNNNKMSESNSKEYSGGLRAWQAATNASRN